jgi:hypothetical protein
MLIKFNPKAKVLIDWSLLTLNASSFDGRHYFKILNHHLRIIGDQKTRTEREKEEVAGNNLSSLFELSCKSTETLSLARKG